jgi:hypothetical protein
MEKTEGASPGQRLLADYEARLNMALDEFMDWFRQEPRPGGFCKATVSAWRASLERRGLGSSSIIIRMSAIRKREYYLARQLAFLNDIGRATRVLKSTVDGGYFCYPQMASDPWLDPVRGNDEFKRILYRAQVLVSKTLEVF